MPRKLSNSVFSSDDIDIDLVAVQGYTSALVDMSVHEVNIHYLAHSGLSVSDTPYAIFEQAFLQQSEDFALSHFSRFNHSVRLFERFMESESSLISKILLNRSYCQFYNRVSLALLRRIEQEVAIIEANRCQLKQ